MPIHCNYFLLYHPCCAWKWLNSSVTCLQKCCFLILKVLLSTSIGNKKYDVTWSEKKALVAHFIKTELTLCTPNTHICVWVWSKKNKKKEKKTFHSWDQTHNYRVGRLVSYPQGHQGSWVCHERLCSYSFLNRVNYDTQIKHSACKGLMK